MVWSKCIFMIQIFKRVFMKWEIGEECDNDYFVQVKVYILFVLNFFNCDCIGEVF